jgi:2-dehydropantoate 2-reductase
LVLKHTISERFHFPQQTITPNEDPIEHLLVCTKAWAVESAIKAVAPRLSATSVVVLLCNGMGLAEAVAPLIGEAQLVVGSTTSGCRRSSEGELIVSGDGRTQLGMLDSSPAPTWLSPWRQGVPEFEWETGIRSVLLGKVALNAVINPLTALHGVTNGDLMQPPLRAITEDVIKEVAEPALQCRRRGNRLGATGASTSCLRQHRRQSLIHARGYGERQTNRD